MFAGRQSQAKIDSIQQDKIATMRKNKDLVRIIEAQEKAHRGLDIKRIVRVNQEAIRIQAWARMLKVRKGLTL